MRARTRATLILVATLVLGFVLGALASGALVQQRAERLERLRARGGFVEHTMRVIAPRDDAQRAAILPIVEATARRNGDIVEGSRDALRQEMDRMREELAPHLDPDQKRRLEEEARWRDPFRRRGPGPRGGRRPPP